MRPTIFGGLIILVAAIGSIPAHSQSSQTSLCGVPLRPAVVAIRRAIEEHDHHAVRCSIDYTLHNPGMDQHDGNVGTIEVNPRLGGLGETTITHELLHLKLDVEGWPKLPEVSRRADTVAALSHAIINEYLSSEVQHQEIFRRMRRLGMDPNANFLADVRAHRGQISPVWDRFPQIAAVKLIRLQAADSDLANSMMKTFDQHGLSRAVMASKAVHAEIVKSSPIRKNDSIHLVNRCAEIVWRILPDDVTLTPQELLAMLSHQQS